MAEIQTLKPKERINRVIAVVGMRIADQEAYWLGFHMERLLAYCRNQVGLLDLATSAAAYNVYLPPRVCRLIRARDVHGHESVETTQIYTHVMLEDSPKAAFELCRFAISEPRG